jgi:hypothetical protein
MAREVLEETICAALKVVKSDRLLQFGVACRAIRSVRRKMEHEEKSRTLWTDDGLEQAEDQNRLHIAMLGNKKNEGTTARPSRTERAQSAAARKEAANRKEAADKEAEDEDEEQSHDGEGSQPPSRPTDVALANMATVRIMFQGGSAQPERQFMAVFTNNFLGLRDAFYSPLPNGLPRAYADVPIC